MNPKGHKAPFLRLPGGHTEFQFLGLLRILGTLGSPLYGRQAVFLGNPIHQHPCRTTGQTLTVRSQLLGMWHLEAAWPAAMVPPCRHVPVADRSNSGGLNGASFADFG